MQYFKSLEACKTRMDDIDEINRIRKFFAENKVKIVKFNHSLDSDVQRFTQFDGYMTIDQETKYIEFTIKKPNNNPKYILEADPMEVEKQQKRYQQKMKEKLRAHQHDVKCPARTGKRKSILEVAKESVVSQFQDSDDSMINIEKEREVDLPGQRGIENEVILEYLINTAQDFVLDGSSSSCYIDDIEAFVFGPFTSRFWLLRKHIMMLDKQKVASMPFYGWDCISL